MSYYPIFIDLKEKKIMVVGGGPVAQRKIERFIEYEADIHVIAKHLTPTLEKHLDEGRIKHAGREFEENFLNGAYLVIAATGDHDLNRQISSLARKRGLLINAVDQPSDCSFIVPSILRRGDLIIAVSTSGKSPALSKKIKEDLGKNFGCEYEQLIALLGRLRSEILSKGLSQDKNRRIFNKIVRSPILDAIMRKDFQEISSILNEALQTQLTNDEVMDYLRLDHH